MLTDRIAELESQVEALSRELEAARQYGGGSRSDWHLTQQVFLLERRVIALENPTGRCECGGPYQCACAGGPLCCVWRWDHRLPGRCGNCGLLRDEVEP